MRVNMGMAEWWTREDGYKEGMYCTSVSYTVNVMVWIYVNQTCPSREVFLLMVITTCHYGFEKRE
jgi:hypothetical protein